MACMIASIVVLKRLAIRDKVSPSTTTYVRGAPGEETVDVTGAATVGVTDVEAAGEEAVDVMGVATVGVTNAEAAGAGVRTGVGLARVKIPESPKISTSKQDGVSQSGCHFRRRYFFNCLSNWLLVSVAATFAATFFEATGCTWAGVPLTTTRLPSSR